MGDGGNRRECKPIFGCEASGYFVVGELAGTPGLLVVLVLVTVTDHLESSTGRAASEVVGERDAILCRTAASTVTVVPSGISKGCELEDSDEADNNKAVHGYFSVVRETVGMSW